MATSVSERVSERTLESLGSGGMAILPWTKHLLTVLWEQLRLLVQVIYYTFMSVFQMFRFEVHVRITDETGEHIQHMSTAASPSESFLFSSNFCADVGDPFSGKSTAEALLSSLRADDLCCGLVDDFVTRTSGKEDGIFLGHQSSWQMGFPGDWNIFVSSSEGSGSSDGCQSPDRAPEPGLPRRKAFRPDASEEERSPLWSECSEEEQSVAEFDSEENRALWESLSRSSDPYNPFFFSACVSTAADMGRSKGETPENGHAERPAVDVVGPPVLDMLVSRSDSESSWSSWAGSEGSSPDVDREESQRLWDLFSSPQDPYNPLCFTASTVSCTRPPQTAGLQQAPLPAAPPKLCSEAEESWSSPPPPEDEEELLFCSALMKPVRPRNAPSDDSLTAVGLHRDSGPLGNHQLLTEEEEEEEEGCSCCWRRD
ncbi:unnamed protein product [Menidia menidia]|uniref:(Atlantic silverside) hypothetical protein n=1 Tax=Menidia menidia TaxID=238744 RepID=A0A8S4BDR3_9TELE|nr:unnamed protein product [Menidia menidia]